MKKKTREFIQHLSHEFDDEHGAENYLTKSLPLIGLVVMYFNGLERSLDSLICEAITERSDSPGLLVIQKLAYSAKVDLFKRFCEDLHTSIEAQVPGFTELIANLTETGQLRNLVVHADWENTDHEGYTFVRIKTAQGKTQQEYIQFSAESLARLIERILQGRKQLEAYWERHVELLHRNPAS